MTIMTIMTLQKRFSWRPPKMVRFKSFLFEEPVPSEASPGLGIHDVCSADATRSLTSGLYAELRERFIDVMIDNA